MSPMPSPIASAHTGAPFPSPQKRRLPGDGQNAGETLAHLRLRL